uniref:Ribosomal protein S13 n=1 Tax=Poteriospumella lacustris TaxID=1117027 RepID=A0A7S6PV45_9STRA|nr:ribosomal protein S13 [Poteriospumella lacustris]
MVRTLIRILGNTLDSRKKVYIALTRIYGIGISRSKSILKSLNINPDVKVSDLTIENVSSLRDLLENETFQLEGNLKRLLKQNINRLIEIGSYRGKRHLKGLPARGQRTRTNSRTSRKLTNFKSKK